MATHPSCHNNACRALVDDYAQHVCAQADITCHLPVSSCLRCSERKCSLVSGLASIFVSESCCFTTVARLPSQPVAMARSQATGHRVPLKLVALQPGAAVGVAAMLDVEEDECQDDQGG